jgi:tRNA pseudouridine38-40 synthase
MSLMPGFLAKELKDDIASRVKQFTYCISKSTKNYREWLEEDYSRRLRQQINKEFYRFYYLVNIQYLGYRLHGWQRQPNFKTVEGLIKKTLKFVLPNIKTKQLGSSRTDAMVSANQSAFELFVYDDPLPDLPEFLQVFNKNLPPDIRALSIEEVDASFNIIQHPKQKEYLYLFSFGNKNHPFCAPLMANFQEELDIKLMKKGAELFQGEHNFKNYTVAPSEKTRLIRTVDTSLISENDFLFSQLFSGTKFCLYCEGQRISEIPDKAYDGYSYSIRERRD